MDVKKQFLIDRLTPYLKGREMDVCFNKNKQTIIRVINVTKKSALLSLHEMFLGADAIVLQALVSYVFARGIHQKKAKQVLKGFIEETFQKLDLSNSLRSDTMQTSGLVHDLKSIYRKVNKGYFSGDLSLSITWYGRKIAKRKKSIVCGLFDHPHRLIKVHRQLDQPVIPDYYVEFIVYHEMLHYVLPPYRDQRGNMCIHGKEFKAKEREFKYYKDVVNWEKSHAEIFFK